MQAIYSPFQPGIFKTTPKHFGIGGYRGIVDALGIALSIGFSLRKLRKAYTGNCVTIRRSSDDTTTNIGFTAAGDFDNAAYFAFCGRNFLLNTATLSTQSVTVVPKTYVLSFQGTGTVTLSGTSTAGPLVGTGAGDRVSLSFTPTAGSLTLTVSGSVTSAQLEFGSTAATYEARTGTAASGGFITTWFDQSGNAQDVTQGTEANQPRLVPRQHGEKPSAYGDGTDDLQASYAGTDTDFAIVAVVSMVAGGGYQAIATFGYEVIYGSLASGASWGTYNGVEIPAVSSYPTSKSNLIVNSRNYDDLDLVKNGSLSNHTRGTIYNERAATAVFSDAANKVTGDIYEVFLLSSALSSGQLSSLNASAKSYWGTP